MAKQKSWVVKGLDQVQAGCSEALKASGFRKRGRTHNRAAKDGVVHAVNFQSGQYPIGDYVVPGLREDRYGWFAVNLGVFVPCISKLEYDQDPGSWTPEWHCHIRSRLREDPDTSDQWWQLDCDLEATANLIRRLLRRAECRFFSDFGSYEKILGYFDEAGRFPGSNEGRSTLEAAMICHHLGETDRAQEMFASAGATNHSGFRSHVEEVAKRIGYHTQPPAADSASAPDP